MEDFSEKQITSETSGEIAAEIVDWFSNLTKEEQKSVLSKLKIDLLESLADFRTDKKKDRLFLNKESGEIVGYEDNTSKFIKKADELGRVLWEADTDIE